MSDRANTYSDPAFIASAHAWAREIATSLGLEVSGPIEQPHLRPWSTVFRVPTSHDAVYLKCCGPTQAHEPRLSALLKRVDPALSPDVLALHPELPWMLVADGGVKMRDAYSGDAILDAWRALLPRHAELQRALAPYVGDALAYGTPDHRAAPLLEAFASAIDDEPSLSGARPDRLTPVERHALDRLVPTLERACRELGSLGIEDTIQHDDLHHGNVLVRDGRAVVFDWGDACVSHPFLVLAVTLRFAAEATGRAEGDPRILALRDAYLEPWTDRAGAGQLLEAADLARRIGQASRTLTFHVIARAYKGVIDAYPGGLAGSLRRVLALFAGPSSV
jgi:hypothetical protein